LMSLTQIYLAQKPNFLKFFTIHHRTVQPQVNLAILTLM
jgi:hypothetical protein